MHNHGRRSRLATTSHGFAIWFALVAFAACGDPGTSSDTDTDTGAASDAEDLRWHRCGNGVCGWSETCSTCPADCGACSAGTPDASTQTDASAQTDAGASSTLNVVQLGPSATASQIAAAIANNSTDIIELLAGTYTPGQVKVDVDRTRPVVIRPAAGAAGKVIWKGTSSAGAFLYGLNSRAGRVNLDGLVFDGFALGDTGVIWIGNAHDLSLTNITVRNSTGQRPGWSWALYVSTAGGHGPSNIVANDWVVEGAGSRSLSAMTSYHTPNATGVTLHRWNVKNVAYAVYAASDATGLDFADWTIDDAGYTTSANYAVYFAQVKGTYKNMHLTNSGTLKNNGSMTDGGGNTY